ncbi:MAG: hypothetical protein RL660_843 [Bacteroidota bacterium]
MAFLPHKSIGFAIVLSLICTLAVFTWQFFPRKDTLLKKPNSSLTGKIPQLGKEEIANEIIWHDTTPIFETRSFVTEPVKFINAATGIHIAYVFLTYSMLLLVICGVLLHRITYVLSNNGNAAVLSILLFYSMFSIVCMYYITNYTYDEPAQYVLLLLGVLASLRQRFVLSVCAFAAACIARDSSFLMVLPFAFVYVIHAFKQKQIVQGIVQASALLGTAVVVYFIYLYLCHPHTFSHDDIALQSTRTTLWREFNFKDMAFAKESLVSWFLACGFLAFATWRLASLKSSEEKITRLVQVYLICMTINSFTVLAFAYARESRLFALPNLLIIPVVAIGLQKLFAVSSFAALWQAAKQQVLKPIHMVYLLLLIVGTVFIYTGYETTVMPAQKTFNREYFVVTLFAIYLLQLFTAAKNTLQIRPRD